MTNDTDRVRTAIVIGGGIAGPVTGLALRKAGIDATVYEAYPTTADGVGGALTLAPNGLAALASIGATPYVEPLGDPAPRMIMETGAGRRLGVAEDLPGLPTSRVFARAELYAGLLAALRAAGVPVEHGKRLVGYEQHAGRVTAAFADGTHVTADLLVGADGIHSTVRGLLDPAAPKPRYVGLLGFVGWVPAGTVPPTNGALHMAFGKKAFFGYLALEHHTGWFANLACPDPLTAAEAQATPAEQWLRRLKSLYAEDRIPAVRMLDHTDPAKLINTGGMHDMPPVPTWWRDRVVLVGDAAHATSPTSGQGASLAIESAVELARCLRDLPAAQALRAYESLRRPRVELIIKRTARINNDKALGPVGRLVRDLAFPVALKTFYHPEKVFGWIHRHTIDWAAPVH